MEVSASKRRKTSPTTGVPVHDSNETVLGSSDSAARRASRLNQPSFVSPTQPSLARANPEIPQRRASLGDTPRSDGPADYGGGRGDPASTQLGMATESGAGSLQRHEGGGTGIPTAYPMRRPIAMSESGLKPKRSPEKPSPRPLPPPSAEEEELIDPFKGRKLRRSPPPGVFPRIQPEEPQLPPTPVQRGLSEPSSMATSSMGIHNTPSKRPRRSKALAARMNSSPTKQLLALRPPREALSTIQEPSSSRLGRDSLREEPRRKRSAKPKFNPARQIEEPDPLADKKALRDSLLAEVAQLQEDLKVTSRENERLSEMQKSRRATVELPAPAEQSRLLDVLSRHALPPEKEAPPDPMQSWLEAAMNPIAFLPFGQPNAIALPPFVMPSAEKENAEKPPISHHPVSMTAEEELPYLQVFTPLTFSSNVTTMQPEAGHANEHKPLLQRHAISVASSPPGLFMATIDMTVNTKTMSISELAVPQLDSSAVGELKPFVDKILSDENNSALTKNVSVITWAMGEWVRAATRRAGFWYAARRELGSTERILECAEAMRRRNRRRPARGQNLSDDEEDDDDGGKSRPSRADVISLLGRTSLDIDLSGAVGNGDDDGDDGLLTARVQWRIEFDWTGEAKSTIGLLLSAPARWHASDGKGSLAGLSAMFDKLLGERKDPLEALKIVVALIVGDRTRA